MHDALTSPISSTTFPTDSLEVPTIYQENVPLLLIPIDVLLKILFYTRVKGLATLEMTSKKFTLLFDNLKIWDKLLLKDFPDLLHKSQPCTRNTYIEQYLIEENWATGKFTYTELKRGNSNYSPVIANSECIICEGSNSALQIWDRSENTFKEYCPDNGHDGFSELHLTKTKIAFYVTFGCGGEVRFFDNINKKLVRKLRSGWQHILHENLFIYKKHPEWNCIQNRYIGNDCIEIIDIDSQNLLFNLESSTDISTGIYIDGGHVIAGDKEGAIKIWNLENGTLLYTFKDEHQILGISSICFDHDCLVAIYADNSMNVWNKDTKLLLWSMGNISTCTFDQKNLIIANHENDISIVDKYTGNRIFLFPEVFKESVEKISEIRSRRNQIITRAFKEIKIWDKTTGTLILSLEGTKIILSEESLITQLSDKLRIWNFS